MYALELMGKLSLADKFFKTEITDKDSPAQSNGYDCGIYVAMYANKLAEGISNGNFPNLEITPSDATEYRRALRNKINSLIEFISKDKKLNKISLLRPIIIIIMIIKITRMIIIIRSIMKIKIN